MRLRFLILVLILGALLLALPGFAVGGARRLARRARAAVPSS
jgi:hypothetical protein